MKLLNINHKLILFSFLLHFIALIYFFFEFYNFFPGFFEFFLPQPMSVSGWRYVPLGLEFFAPILGVTIVFLAVTNKIKKIEFALIPVLIFYAYLFPVHVFEYPSDLIYSFSNIACFILMSYGTFNLIKEKSEETQEIDEKEKITNNLSTELSDKEFIPTLLLCLFVGMIGVHRFYVGKIGTGVVMIFTLGGLGIWVLVDFIMICIGSFRDKEGRIVKNQPVVAAVQGTSTGVAEELEKFAELKEKGIISEEEFDKKKQELL